ncbi:recombinase family protein [Rufibacter sp. LB8]|uniref:recombinase family protein n=1 Tax=Rufibacter sp. LB8 TaxID=2777781 RepID=UPI00351BEE3C
MYAADQIRKMANARGLKCERSNFWKIIRNPVYCGLVPVAAYGGEEATTAKGQHEPIIPESLFLQVQDILDGNSRPQGTKVCSPEAMPLRGFLSCPLCTRMLTGSASKGMGGYYHYYHCSSECGVRFRAGEVNAAFERELARFQLNPGAAELFRKVVKDVFSSRGSDEKEERKLVIEQIGEQERLLTAARKRLLLEEIDADDFREIKKDCKEKMARLEAKLADLPAKGRPAKPIETLLDEVVGNFSDLEAVYRNAPVEGKRRLVSSIFPGKITFDGKAHRTEGVNEAAELMFLVNRELTQKKKRKNSVGENSSALVVRRGIEPLLPE